MKSNLPSSCPYSTPGQQIRNYLEIAFVFQLWNASLESRFILFF